MILSATGRESYGSPPIAPGLFADAGKPSADALTPRALRTRGPGRVLVLSASGVRTLMLDVPSIQDKVLAALTARLTDD